LDKRKLVLCMKAILETLSEVDGAPESILWLPFSVQRLLELDQFQLVIAHLVKMDLITNKSHWVQITEKGRELLKIPVMKAPTATTTTPATTEAIKC
jgi:predicted transcriptional regulator